MLRPSRHAADPFGLLSAADLLAGDLSADALAALTSRLRATLDEYSCDDAVCAACGGQMCRGETALESVCEGCGRVVEGDTAADEDDARAPPSTACLRIVGSNSKQLQPDLYRSGNGNTKQSQTKQIEKEYCEYRARYIEAGGQAFPINACRLASEYYNFVQSRFVKRSESKKQIMAACFWQACLDIDFAPSKSAVADFMQLSSKGISRGVNFLRTLAADGGMEVDLNRDPCRPEIATLFAQLGLDGPAHAGLRDAVYDVVQVAMSNNIATNSVLRSKVAGATFEVLRRCATPSLVPRTALNLATFCEGRIRKNTVERVIKEINGYLSYFAPTFARHGLNPQ